MISLSIPNYNRSDFVIESFINVIDDHRISEIVISDDFSDLKIFNDLIEKVNKIDSPKIKIFRNESNMGSFLNKYNCVSLSSSKWIILLDSDNIIQKDYIDIVSSLENENILYCPSHAICESPKLNYSNYVGLYDRYEFKRNIFSGDDVWDCVFNTGNYFFHRENYLKCVDSEVELLKSYALDGYYLTYLWYKNLDNPYVQVVDGLKYYHRLHGSSHWLNNQHNSDQFQIYLKNKIFESFV